MELSNVESVLSFVPYVILLVGNVACLGNFLTFTSKSLRRNPCGWYFLFSSIFDCLCLNFGLTSKLANERYGSTLQDRIVLWCRLRVFFTWVLPCCATAYLFLASLDRCLSTSRNVRCRAFSQIRFAHRLTCVPILLYSLTNCHQLFFYDLRPTCAPLPGTYAFFLSLYSIIWTNLVPQFGMLICGFLTYSHIQQTRQRGGTDAHLIRMTLFQVISSSVLLNLRTGYYSYMVLTSDTSKDEHRREWENVLLQISSWIFYLNFTKSFFVNTLTSKFFRRRFAERARCLMFWRRRVHPQRAERIG